MNLLPEELREAWDRFELSNKSFADFPLKPLGYHAGIITNKDLQMIRAGNGTRTRDFNLGKVALYQLSYSRINNKINRINLLFQVAFLSKTISVSKKNK